MKAVGCSLSGGGLEGGYDGVDCAASNSSRHQGMHSSLPWLQERLLPGDLQQRVRRYYAETWLPMECERGAPRWPQVARWTAGPHKASASCLQGFCRRSACRWKRYAISCSALLMLAAGQDEEQLEQLPAALRGEVVWRLAGPALRASRLLGTLPEEVRMAWGQRLEPAAQSCARRTVDPPLSQVQCQLVRCSHSPLMRRPVNRFVALPRWRSPQLLLFLSASLAPLYLPAGRDLFKQGDDVHGEVFLLQSGAGAGQPGHAGLCS